MASRGSIRRSRNIKGYYGPPEYRYSRRAHPYSRPEHFEDNRGNSDYASFNLAYRDLRDLMRCQTTNSFRNIGRNRAIHDMHHMEGQICRFLQYDFRRSSPAEEEETKKSECRHTVDSTSAIPNRKIASDTLDSQASLQQLSGHLSTTVISETHHALKAMPHEGKSDIEMIVIPAQPTIADVCCSQEKTVCANVGHGLTNVSNLEVSCGPIEMNNVCVGPTEMNSVCVGPTEMTSFEVGQTDMTSVEVGPTEMTNVEVGQTEMSMVEVGQTEITSVEVGQTEMTCVEVGQTKMTSVCVGQTEMTRVEVGQTEMTWVEVGQTEMTCVVVDPMEITSVEVGQTEMTCVGVCQTEMTSVEVGPTEMSSVEVGSTEMSSVEVSCGPTRIHLFHQSPKITKSCAPLHMSTMQVPDTPNLTAEQTQSIFREQLLKVSESSNCIVFSDHSEATVSNGPLFVCKNKVVCEETLDSNGVSISEMFNVVKDRDVQARDGITVVEVISERELNKTLGQQGISLHQGHVMPMVKSNNCGPIRTRNIKSATCHLKQDKLQPRIPQYFASLKSHCSKRARQKPTQQQQGNKLSQDLLGQELFIDILEFEASLRSPESKVLPPETPLTTAPDASEYQDKKGIQIGNPTSSQTFFSQSKCATSLEDIDSQFLYQEFCKETSNETKGMKNDEGLYTVSESKLGNKALEVDVSSQKSDITPFMSGLSNTSNTSPKSATRRVGQTLELSTLRHCSTENQQECVEKGILQSAAQQEPIYKHFSSRKQPSENTTSVRISRSDRTVVFKDTTNIRRSRPYEPTRHGYSKQLSGNSCLRAEDESDPLGKITNGSSVLPHLEHSKGKSSSPRRHHKKSIHSANRGQCSVSKQSVSDTHKQSVSDTHKQSVSDTHKQSDTTSGCHHEDSLPSAEIKCNTRAYSPYKLKRKVRAYSPYKYESRAYSPYKLERKSRAYSTYKYESKARAYSPYKHETRAYYPNKYETRAYSPYKRESRARAYSPCTKHEAEITAILDYYIGNSARDRSPLPHSRRRRH